MSTILTVAAAATATTSCDTTTPKADTATAIFSVDTVMTSDEIAARRFTPTVMMRMGRLGSSSLAPDGRSILYVMTYYNVEQNRGNSSLWVMPYSPQETSAAFGAAVQITDNASNNSDPVWSPDGKSIYFLSDRSGSSQIWRVCPDGSQPTSVSNLEQDISGFGLAPSGDRLWFVQDVKVDKVSSAERYPGRDKSKALIYDDLMERHWNCWEDGSYNHIFVAELSGDGTIQNPTDIMPGEPWDAPTAPYFDMSELAWNNSGTALAYTCKKLVGYQYSMSTDSDIYLYNVADSSTRNLTEGMPGYDKYPRFSPDDRFVAWQSMERRGNESDKDRLMVMNLGDGTKQYLTRDFDYNAANLSWSADGASIYFIAPIEATHQICRVDLADSCVSVLTTGLHDYMRFSMTYVRPASAGGTECVAPSAMTPRMVAEMTTISMATELFDVDLSSQAQTQSQAQVSAASQSVAAAASQLTFVNRSIYDNVDMGQVQKRWVTTTDNKKMLVWVILPPDFDSTRTYPTLLYCQGGPQSVVSQRWSYRWNFQLMASAGYIVVAPNRRGLPSFGQEWLDQISGDYSGQNIRDYLSAIDDVARDRWVDTSRLGCVGASYGGYSVFYLAGHHQRRFKAFVAHCGMFNLESFYGETEELWFPHNDLGGAYWERPANRVADRSYANSPHLFVNNWDTPMLIITGLKDFRIPYTQSLQAFTAARAHGVESRLVAFEDEGHQVFKPQNSLVWHSEFFAWLDKYLKRD